MTPAIIPDYVSSGWQVVDTARRDAPLFVIDVTRGSIHLVMSDTDTHDAAVMTVTAETLGMIRECIDRVLAAYQPPEPAYEPAGVRGGDRMTWVKGQQAVCGDRTVTVAHVTPTGRAVVQMPFGKVTFLQDGRPYGHGGAPLEHASPENLERMIRAERDTKLRRRINDVVVMLNEWHPGRTPALGEPSPMTDDQAEMIGRVLDFAEPIIRTLTGNQTS